VVFSITPCTLPARALSQTDALGVSLPLLRRLLADLGISLTSLWA